MSKKNLKIVTFLFCIALLAGAVPLLATGHPYWGIVFILCAGAVMTVYGLSRGHQAPASGEPQAKSETQTKS